MTEGFSLRPAGGVVPGSGGLVAVSNDAWLEFADPSPFTRARFVEIVYRAGLYDDPVRPELKFITAKGETLRILPGPVAGAGLWRGAVPQGVERVFISPCAREGRFDFIVESVRALSHLDMAALVWRRRRAKLWSIALASAFGYFAEAERAMDWAIGGEPLENFEGWRARRLRALDLAGLDAPRSDWSAGPAFLILIELGDKPRLALERTLASLEAQAYRKFKISEIEPGRPPPSLAGIDFVCRLRTGDELAPYALALIAEEAARSQAIKFFYADETILGPEGARACFKPAWSPRFEQARPYLGRALFLSAQSIGAENLNAEGFRAAALRAGAGEIAHLRRSLLTRAEEQPPQPPPTARWGRGPSVSIIMLTRDRADLLKPCVETLLGRSTHQNYELIIVDNGTTDVKALAVLRAAAKDSRVRLLSRPEPFNFAAFNNEAARDAKGEVLVFLNNDTEILTPDWLEQMSLAAAEPDVGAVGALLLFPDGRIQHSGVVVGLGEEAGHFEALRPPEAPSWLSRNLFPRETAAVTGACLAVERRKFEAVHGFDAESFPIESNDIDLCLRLLARGWPGLYLPSVRLIHKESASRGGAKMRPMSVYARERERFQERWGHIIRDDPYFHPGLSLYSRQTALG
jgi:O-antigen biosynthesis protein